ncbi:hypothetical protein HK100_000375 [Physocladia obscura]|uniref:Uncharacterized protein n=1 Tax=Physocladia obscura TaxID=109957 RepID=A0AAD5SYJ5_9FUNG|nr:hypothetical protein HK100_000375 [Physocladia obscura]
MIPTREHIIRTEKFKANKSFLHSHELKVLAKNFETSKPFTSIVYGDLPGKTIIAREFAYKFPMALKRYKARILWITCTGYPEIMRSLRAALRSVKIAVPVGEGFDSMRRKFGKWVSTTTVPFLLVLDGIPTLEVFDLLLPPAIRVAHHILITTRIRSQRDLAKMTLRTTGEAVMVPVGEVLKSDLVSFLNIKGSYAVAKIVDDGLGDAIYYGIAEAYVRLEKCSYQKLGQFVSTAMNNLRLFWGQKLDKDEVHEELVIIVRLSMELLERHFGVIGRAAVALLEILSIACMGLRLSTASLTQCLDLGDNQVVVYAIQLLESMCLLRAEQENDHTEIEYTVHTEIRDAILIYGPKLPLSMLSSSIIRMFKQISVECDGLLDGILNASRFINSCNLLLTHVRNIMKFDSKVPIQEHLEPICSLLMNLAVSLLNDAHYQQSVEALMILADLVKVSTNSSRSSLTRVAHILDLAGCVTCQSISQSLINAMSCKNMATTAFAISVLEKSLTAVESLAVKNTPTIELARQHANLAYIYANTLHTEPPTSRLDLHAFTKKFRDHAACAEDMLTAVLGTFDHIAVVGATLVRATACLSDGGDRFTAWACVKRAMDSLRTIYNINEENCWFTDPDNGPFDNAKINVGAWSFEEASYQALVDQLLGVSAKGSQSVTVHRNEAKAMFRRILLGADEIKSGKCGKIFWGFINRYKNEKSKVTEVKMEYPMVVSQNTAVSQEKRMRNININMEGPSEISDHSANYSTFENTRPRIKTNDMQTLKANKATGGMYEQRIRSVTALPEQWQNQHEYTANDQSSVFCDDSISCRSFAANDASLAGFELAPEVEDQSVLDLLAKVESALALDADSSQISEHNDDDNALLDAVKEALQKEQSLYINSSRNTDIRFPQILNTHTSDESAFNPNVLKIDEQVKSITLQLNNRGYLPHGSDMNLNQLHSQKTFPHYPISRTSAPLAPSQTKLKPSKPSSAFVYNVPKIEYDSFWAKGDDDTFIERVAAPVMAKYNVLPK